MAKLEVQKLQQNPLASFCWDDLSPSCRNSNNARLDRSVVTLRNAAFALGQRSAFSCPLTVTCAHLHLLCSVLMMSEPAGCFAKNVTPSAEMVEVLVDGARYGDMEDVQSALQHSVDVNATDSSGRTGKQ